MWSSYQRGIERWCRVVRDKGEERWRVRSGVVIANGKPSGNKQDGRWQVVSFNLRMEETP